MCNLYALKTTRAHVAELFRAEGPAGAEAVGEIYPRRLAPVVSRAGPGASAGRAITDMRWGVPPPPGVAAPARPVTNVRNLKSPFWRPALADPRQRCLVPATGFAEWAGEVGRKEKRWFRVPAQPVFAFAGLWRPGPGGACFAILTCAPNPLVAAIHPKAMPVILHAEDHDRWLEAPLDDVVGLAAPFPSQLMHLEPAGTRSGDDGN